MMGRSSTPQMSDTDPRTIETIIGARASLRPDAEAIEAPGRRPLTYRALERHLAETGRALGAHGVGRHDRVALVLGNGPEMATAFLAVAARAICAPLNPALRAEEYHRQLARLRPTALVTDARPGSPAREAAGALGVPVIDLLRDTEGAAGCFTLAGPAGATAPARSPASRPDDVALILPTSGTTAQAKLVPLTHAALCASARATAASLALGPDDRCLGVMPLFHIHGLVGALLASLEAGGSVVCTAGLHAPSFSAWLDAHRPTWYTAVPTMHQAVLAHAGARPDRARPHTLRVIRSCSAPLPSRVLADLEDAFGVPVVEAYGMTEAAHQVTSNPLPPHARKPGSVGVATGTEVAVVDAAGACLPAGASGEIVVRGPSVTAGYLEDDEATARAFAGGWLRTGDLGVLDADGYLSITGRLKEVINRGGEKIAPREVEDVLSAHPEVAEAVAFPAPHAQLGEEVAAAVVRRAGSELGARALRAFAAERLAEFKVPRHVLFLPALPQGATGKIQRLGLAEALGITGRAASAGPATFTPPRTPLEREVVLLWTQVLGIAGAGVLDDFFETGGDSLLATQLLVRVRHALGAVVPLHVFFEAPTAAALAREVETARRAPGGAAPAPIRPVPRGPDSPLSFGQERAWFFDQLAPGNPAYNRPTALRLTGSLDHAALGRALTEIVRRHEVLRATFPSVDGMPVQRRGPDRAVTLPVVDLTHVPPADRDAAARRAAAAVTRRPFNLAREPVMRAALLRLGERDHVLLVVIHHVAVDGWSASLLVREVTALYQAYEGGRPSPLPELPLQYADATLWQRRSLPDDALERRVRYWTERLAGAPPTLAVPTDRPRPARPTFRGGRETADLPEALALALRGLCREEGVTLFMTLYAAFAVVLHRYTGQDDLVVGVPVAARAHVETEGLIGCFVNAIALRTDLSGAPTFRTLLTRVRDAAREAYAHQDVPFAKVVEALRPGRDTSYMPVVQVVFNLEHFPDPPSHAGRLAVAEFDFDAGAAPMELLVEVIERGGRLSCVVTYATDLFDGGTIQRLLGHYVNVLEGVAADPERPIVRVPLLSAAERHRLLVDWGAPTAPYPECTLQALFEAQARLTPEAVAVHWEDERIGYAELNRRANRLAHHLRGLGVGVETRVAIAIERSPEQVVALLAVLKAGGAYVPLDIAYPPARLGFMMAEAGCAFLLARGSFAASLPAHGARVVSLEAGAAALARERGDDLASGVGPDGLAYVLYTSGSTGQPKGIAGHHRGLVNLAECWRRKYPCGPGDVWTLRSGFGMLDYLQELLVALTQGAAVALVPDEASRDMSRLLETMSRHGATHVMLVPTILRAWLDAHEDLARLVPSLTLVSVGGEPFPRDLWRAARESLPRGCRILQGYGMTEASTKSTWCDTALVETARPTVPIGRPLANVEAYVLDRHLEPTPIGVPGELYVGGVGVTRGYAAQPGLTAERFVPNPFTETPGARLYRTGDVMRFLPDGTLEALGRTDHQVKVRGMRVELTEVQSALERHRAVKQAVVLARTDGRRDAGLVAYVAAERGAAPAAEDLRRFLRGLLPEYMVPGGFVVLETLPLLPGGKVNRAALPAPGADRPATAPYVAPRTPVEAAIAEIWAEVLGLERVGIDDDFFALGGHSLLASRIVARVARRLGAELSMSALLGAPTVAELALVVGQRRLAAAAAVTLDGDLGAAPPGDQEAEA